MPNTSFEHTKTPVDLSIRAKWILTVNPTDEVIHEGVVLIHEGKIVAILNDHQQPYQSKKHIDMPHHMLIPGLINAHAHSPMSVLRGLGDDKDLMSWLNDNIWPAEGALMQADFIKEGTQIAMAEMILSGTTTFCEHYFMPEVSMETSIEAGMRCNIGLWVGDGKTPWQDDGTACIRHADNLLSTHKAHPLISWSMAPHSPYLVGDATFKDIGALAEQYQLPIHIHMHESEHEINESLEKYKMRPLARLNQMGLVNQRFVGVHNVHANEDDFAIMVKQGAHVIHCPMSNLKLGNGFAPVKAMLDHGINVGLGTDGAASNNSINMLEDMRLASLIAKGVNGDATALHAKQTLRLATINNAKAFGLDHLVGSIEVGKMADLVAININHPQIMPVHNPYLALTYTHISRFVTDVWVQGRPLLAQGKFMTLSHEGLSALAAQWAERTQTYADPVDFS